MKIIVRPALIDGESGPTRSRSHYVIMFDDDGNEADTSDLYPSRSEALQDANNRAYATGATVEIERTLPSA